MMLKVGVLGFAVPLLFGFDPTHESEAGAPSADVSAVASLAAVSDDAGGQRDTGPAYLGLGMSRSNMQASLMHVAGKSLYGVVPAGSHLITESEWHVRGPLIQVPSLALCKLSWSLFVASRYRNL